MIERVVRYFDRPGPANTEATIQAAHAFLKDSDEVASLVVASISGQTALKVMREVADASVLVVCVTGPPSWQNHPEYRFPLISEDTRKELEDGGVSIVDSVPSSLSDTMEFSYARYGFRSPTWLFVETLLAIGGYGLKTAVECVLMATDGGAVPPFKTVVSIAGTDKGADTAIVTYSSFSSTAFSRDSRKRLVVNEILAMPREKIFYKRVNVGEWEIDEVTEPGGD